MCAKLNNFIRHQQVGWTNFFQMSLLLKAVNPLTANLSSIYIKFQMKVSKLMSVSYLIAFMAIGCSDKKTNNSILAGMYKLSQIENFDTTTKQWREDHFGKDGDSYILYDGVGHMAVHITPKGYKDFAWLPERQATSKEFVEHYIDSMPSDQLRPAIKEFSSSFVYTANYSVDNDSSIVTHNRLSSSVPSVWGTRVTRHFAFSGDTLILTFPDGTKRLKWLIQP
jgi:hypothetical protein